MAQESRMLGVAVLENVPVKARCGAGAESTTSVVGIRSLNEIADLARRLVRSSTWNFGERNPYRLFSKVSLISNFGSASNSSNRGRSFAEFREHQSGIEFLPRGVLMMIWNVMHGMQCLEAYRSNRAWADQRAESLSRFPR